MESGRLRKRERDGRSEDWMMMARELETTVGHLYPVGDNIRLALAFYWKPAVVWFQVLVLHDEHVFPALSVGKESKYSSSKLVLNLS
jgi:hypothetical protein